MSELLHDIIEEFNRDDVVRYFSESNSLSPIEKKLCEAHLEKGGEVLVVGCGAGREAIALAQSGYRVTALDISASMIKAAQEKASELNLSIAFMRGDISVLSIGEGVFHSVVIFNHSLQYIPGKSARRDVLRKIHDALRPGGTVIMDFMKRSFLTNLFLWVYMNIIFRVRMVNRVSVGRAGDLHGRLAAFNHSTSTYYKVYICETLPAQCVAMMMRVKRVFCRNGIQGLEAGDLLSRGHFFSRVDRYAYFRHLYTHNEILDDVRSAGYTISSIQSKEECDIDLTKGLGLIRKASLILYAVLKK